MSNNIYKQSNIYHPAKKTDRTISVPQSPLQQLNCEVQFCISFRIQHCHIPQALHTCEYTRHLAKQIAYLQDLLAVSIREDYEAQKELILLARKISKGEK